VLARQPARGAAATAPRRRPRASTASSCAAQRPPSPPRRRRPRRGPRRRPRRGPLRRTAPRRFRLSPPERLHLIQPVSCQPRPALRARQAESEAQAVTAAQHAEGSSWVALDARPAQPQTDRVVACQGRRRRRLRRAARQLGPAPSRTGRLPRPRRCVLVRPATAPARRRCTPRGARPTSRRPRRRSGPRPRTWRSSRRPLRRMLASAPRAPRMHRPCAGALHHSSQAGARRKMRARAADGARLTETGSVQAGCWGAGVAAGKAGTLTTC